MSITGTGITVATEDQLNQQDWEKRVRKQDIATLASMLMQDLVLTDPSGSELSLDYEVNITVHDAARRLNMLGYTNDGIARRPYFTPEQRRYVRSIMLELPEAVLELLKDKK